MSRSTLDLDEHLLEYLRRVSVRDDDVARRLREETARLENAQMQISPEQGQLMSLLVELTGAERGVEVGTFTGYSALCIARAMPPSGRLHAFDVSEEYTRIARRYWAEAGVADKIELTLGPAVEGLDRLLEAGGGSTFDFAFVDADKTNYDRYYEQCLALLRPGGLLTVDNVLWGGSAANPEDDRPATRAIQALNAKIHADDRVSMSLVPIGDGLTLCRKR